MQGALVSELADCASSLRSEAIALLGRAQLLEMLKERFGLATVVGSVDLDLMTWRDIDIYTSADRTRKSDFLEVCREAEQRLNDAGHELVRAVFNDEWGQPRGDYGSGYYWGLRVKSEAGQEWKIDIWGWEPETFASKVQEHEDLKLSLKTCSRDLILTLKTEAMQEPGFRKTITSWDVYRLILEGETELRKVHPV